MGILRKQISKKFTDILKILSAVLKDIGSTPKVVE